MFQLSGHQENASQTIRSMLAYYANYNISQATTRYRDDLGTVFI